MTLDIYADILDANDRVMGAGPISTIQRWRSTSRADRAGSFQMSIPASDPAVTLIQEKRRVRCYAFTPENTQIELGSGIVDKIELEPADDGSVGLAISGDDSMRELTYRSVGLLQIHDNGEPTTHVDALSSIGSYAPSGWQFTADDNAYDAIYGAFAGESVLAACRQLATASRGHFYLSGHRAVTFASSFTDSGLRAVAHGSGPIAPELCEILTLKETKDSYDQVTRVIPLGAGQGRARLTLAASNRTAPTGFVLDTANNTIINDGLEAGLERIERWVEFKNIAPLSNTDADLQAASNALFDAAQYWLAQHATVERYFSLQVIAHQVLHPMQSIWVAYRRQLDDAVYVDIDERLNILEATIEATVDGVRTTDLVVTTGDRWPNSDQAAQVAELEQGRIFQAHPQLNANSYTTGYTKPVDEDYSALFRFRFGQEVTQLQQVLFDFQILPFESLVKSVGAEAATSGAGGSSSPTSTSGGGGTFTSASGGSQQVSSAGGGGTSLTSSAGGGTTATSNSGGGGTHTAVSGGGQNTTSQAGGASTVTSTDGGGSTYSSSDGGATTESSDSALSGHGHQLNINDNGGSPSGAAVYYDVAGLNAAGGGATQVQGVNLSHSHDVDIPNHSHNVDIPNHAHDVSIPGHTHDVAINSHSHQLTLPSHTHDVTVPGHSHGVTIPDHTHTVNLPNHTHEVSIPAHSHIVEVPDHTHHFTAVIETVFGISRQSSTSTYEANELEYRVNGGAWASLATAESLASGWLRLDLTAAVVNAASFRPLREDNYLEIRQAAGVSESGLSATIDSLLNVRNIIQAIAYL